MSTPESWFAIQRGPPELCLISPNPKPQPPPSTSEVWFAIKRGPLEPGLISPPDLVFVCELQTLVLFTQYVLEKLGGKPPSFPRTLGPEP